MQIHQVELVFIRPVIRNKCHSHLNKATRTHHLLIASVSPLLAGYTQQAGAKKGRKGCLLLSLMDRSQGPSQLRGILRQPNMCIINVGVCCIKGQLFLLPTSCNFGQPCSLSKSISYLLFHTQHLHLKLYSAQCHKNQLRFYR